MPCSALQNRRAPERDLCAPGPPQPGPKYWPSQQNTWSTLLWAFGVGMPNQIYFAQRHYSLAPIKVELATTGAFRSFPMDLNMASCVYSNSSSVLNTTATLFHPGGHQSVALYAVLSTRELARRLNSSCSAHGHMLCAPCTFTPKHGAREKALGQ